MIKKVVISAAGQGTRMLELTKDKSKHLINVESRPFLAYLLDNILTAGYKEIILVAGYREDMIRDFLKTYKPFTNSISASGERNGKNLFSVPTERSDILSNNIELVNGKDYTINIVNQFEILGPKEKEYGTACPLKCVKNFTENENFISLCGDNFYSVEDLKAMNIDDRYNYVAGLKHDAPEKYGVLLTSNDGFLKNIVEKPKEFVGDLINTSLYKFTPEIFNKLSVIEKSPRGEYEITDAISLLAREGKVRIKEVKNFWMDFGQKEDIKTFSDFIKNNNKTVSA